MELEEERRLCYVGITRARRHLAMSHAWMRTLWGQTNRNIPSRFLAEVPPELVRDVGAARTPRAGSGTGRGGAWARRTEGGRAVGAAGGHRAGEWGGPGVDHGTDDGEHGRTFGAGTGPARAPRGSTGAEALGLSPGDTVVHDHWGSGVVLTTKGEGDRAQARVRFAGVGEKNLLLSATPLRRA